VSRFENYESEWACDPVELATVEEEVEAFNKWYLAPEADRFSRVEQHPLRDADTVLSAWAKFFENIQHGALTWQEAVTIALDVIGISEEWCRTQETLRVREARLLAEARELLVVQATELQELRTKIRDLETKTPRRRRIRRSNN
jgi:hypothetical protein